MGEAILSTSVDDFLTAYSAEDEADGIRQKLADKTVIGWMEWQESYEGGLCLVCVDGDGRWLFYEASHCSCHGLEGTFELEDSHPDVLLEKRFGLFPADEVALLKAEIRKRGGSSVASA